MTKIYTLPNCVQCDSTKRLMDSLNIDYEVVDLSSDEESYKMILNMGYKQAPIVISGDQHWSGFRMEKIKSLSA